MWRVAHDSGALDVNSPYSYLLWCRDFAATSMVGRHDGDVVAFVTGYRRPDDRDTLFVWQVAVASAHRRRGIAGQMLEALVTQVAREAPVRYVEATVTTANTPSRRLFEAFAAALPGAVHTETLFGEEDFAGCGDGAHDEEVLYRIGPLTR